MTLKKKKTKDDEASSGSENYFGFETAWETMSLKRRREHKKNQRNMRHLRNRGKRMDLSTSSSTYFQHPTDLKDDENKDLSNIQPNERVKQNFKPPKSSQFSSSTGSLAQAQNGSVSSSRSKEIKVGNEVLKGFDPVLIERIESEVLVKGQSVKFDDIIGLKKAKETIEEVVIWPLKNPEFYTGLRQVPRAVLLFGPPGTGKTMIGKAIAHSVEATFFAISASSLTSKWIGEGEKTVRTLFAVAGARAPSVVFIDEVDSVLGKRSNKENEASLRIKTEFLVRLEGVDSSDKDKTKRLLVVGATNRPQELDEAVRRRFVKRLYIPLPCEEARLALFKHLLKQNENSLDDEELLKLSKDTDGYSGADCKNLATEAAMGSLRDKLRGSPNTRKAPLRPISFVDFIFALRSIRASVSKDELKQYLEWNETYGCL